MKQEWQIDHEIEARFVETFVLKARRERALFLLGGRKRSDFFSQLCHTHEKLLDERRMKLIVARDSPSAFCARIRTAANGQTDAYVMCAYAHLDGARLTIEAAEREMLSMTSAMIIILDATRAFFVPELDRKKDFYDMFAEHV